MHNDLGPSANHREEARARTIAALFDQIRDHDATRSRAEWEAISLVVQAFVRNGPELTELISEPDRDPSLLLNILAQGNETEREFYFVELYRHLHNYLSILATLIDNARVHVKKYQGTEFEVEYQNRVSHSHVCQ